MNWKTLIRDLLAAQWTQRAIAEHIGVTQASISQVLSDRTGSQRGFRFEPGQKLVELHKRVCEPKEMA
ncbi:helix-turn-helix domain-containing protein [Burkholderia glumae]|uniref:helix-turn-helix domain-containing protein n=1 Tax=Burkholderia glumae TaxID=337 RepID=UPI002036F793|nr:hypothetical protein [Burkholderia glumae]MCM2493286.1 hypothetical protein [Burkholderia glumae]UVS93498.1 hypothetical protein EFP17_28400 [Burkholderia glumae]